MKKICLTFYCMLIMASVTAQQHNYKYKVHIVGNDGTEIKKVYESLDALRNDTELQRLEIGKEKNDGFEFMPDGRKHKKFYVERLGGKEREFIFQSWGNSADDSGIGEIPPPPPPPGGSHNEQAVPAPSGEFLEDENGLRNELLADKLITDKSRIKIEFNKGSFFVNDKKQPETFYKKYKQLIEQATGRSIGNHFIYELSMK